MNSIVVFAKKEFKTAYKDKVFLVIVLLFLLMSIASVYIGSTTKSAEMQAYQDIVSMAQSQGSAIPTAPEIYPLAILSNIIEYVTMIGAVLAIFLGFDAFSGERENGTLRLLLTRPFYRDQIITGKLAGAGMIIGALLSATLVFNLGLFTIATGMIPSLSEILRLAVFMILAFVYMMSFYIATLFVSLKTRDRAFGFLIMMIVWIFISFVIPQLADTQRNFAYALSSVSSTVTQVPTDTAISRAIELFSPAVQFKNISSDLLQVVSSTAFDSVFSIIKKNILAIVTIMLPTVIFLIFSYTSVQKENVL
ncbi:ABC transporter permease subunit [Lacrimispora defluvii]|jgi:ABC-2 type transport system permease protein|uniref:ABC transporter permease subunit n=1 Tax=Lacrimispora defluvii TaxID=2719233 RepID=A0ABX1W2S6_9FIRM|nr:ABC transporter permease subunit [Lacrimispora defluvii]NNJ33031.1 ABC transporter permease subunit [Lacrimispora defluvii]